MSIAVLLTVHNRIEATLECLSSLYSLSSKVDIFLVDDGSTDQTSSAVSEQFPNVNLIQGDGNLFWNRGMHLAWQHAAKEDYDYYIWLNNDVELYKNCFEELFALDKQLDGQAVISGIIENEDKTRMLYGGYDSKKKLLKPNGTPQEISHMNGNIVLVPKRVFESVGNLDSRFHHDLGDVDYGKRAVKNGFKCVTTRIAIASGEVNNICRVRANGVGLTQRFKKLFSPLGSNPNIAFHFRKRHYGIVHATAYVLFLLLLNLLPNALVKLIFGNKYT